MNTSNIDSSHSTFAIPGIYSKLLIFTPICFYFALIKIYGVNAPWFDDLRDILEFMIQFFDANSLQEKFALLFKQHNPNRTFVSHVIYLLQYQMFGSLNFNHLMLIANLSAAGLFLTYLYLFNKSNHSIFIAIGVSLLIFQPSPLNVMFWAMAGLSAYLVLLFAFLSLVFLEKNSYKNTFIAALFAYLAIFTNANGIFLPLAIIILKFLEILNSKQEKSAYLATLGNLFLYLILCMIMLIGFFYNYESGHVSASPYVRLQFQLDNIGWFIQNFLFLVGSGYSFESYLSGVALGAAASILISWLIVIKYYTRQPALIAFLFFLLLSLGAVAVMRGEINHPQSVMSSHYYQISMHIWVILFIAYTDLYLAPLSKQFSKAALLIVGLLVCFYIASFTYYTPRIMDACLEKKNWIYQLNKDLLDGTVMRDYYDGLILTSLQRGYFDGNPGEKEYPLPLLSDKQSCYIGGW